MSVIKGKLTTEVVEQVKQGDSEAFTIFYEECIGSVILTLRIYRINESETEDIAQDVMLKAYQSIGEGLQDNSKVIPWLKKIAEHKAIDYKRKQQPSYFSDIEPDDPDGDYEGMEFEIEDKSPEFRPELVADKKAVAGMVKEFMDELPDDQSAAMWAVYGQEERIADLAERLGVSENTVKSRLYQGRKKLELRKDEFKKRSIDLTLIPVTVLIGLAFREETYAAVIAEGSATAAAVASMWSKFAAASSGTAQGSAAAGTSAASGATAGASAAGTASSATAGTTTGASTSAATAVSGNTTSSVTGTAASTSAVTSTVGTSTVPGATASSAAGSTAAAGTSASTAAASSAAATGMALGTKVAIGVLIAAVGVGGGVALKSSLSSTEPETIETIAEETIAETTIEETKAEEPGPYANTPDNYQELYMDLLKLLASRPAILDPMGVYDPDEIPYYDKGDITPMAGGDLNLVYAYDDIDGDGVLDMMFATGDHPIDYSDSGFVGVCTIVNDEAIYLGECWGENSATIYYYPGTGLIDTGYSTGMHALYRMDAELDCLPQIVLSDDASVRVGPEYPSRSHDMGRVLGKSVSYEEAEAYMSSLTEGHEMRIFSYSNLVNGTGITDSDGNTVNIELPENREKDTAETVADSESREKTDAAYEDGSYNVSFAASDIVSNNGSYILNLECWKPVEYAEDEAASLKAGDVIDGELIRSIDWSGDHSSCVINEWIYLSRNLDENGDFTGTYSVFEEGGYQVMESMGKTAMPISADCKIIDSRDPAGINTSIGGEALMKIMDSEPYGRDASFTMATIKGGEITEISLFYQS